MVSIRLRTFGVALIAAALALMGTALAGDELEIQQLDKEIADNAGVLGALRGDATLDSALGATGLNEDMMNGISGLIGSKGQQIGSGGLGARGSGLGGGGTPEGLCCLGTKGRGSGASGYGSGGGHFGSRMIVSPGRQGGAAALVDRFLTLTCSGCSSSALRALAALTSPGPDLAPYDAADQRYRKCAQDHCKLDDPEIPSVRDLAREALIAVVGRPYGYYTSYTTYRPTPAEEEAIYNEARKRLDK